MIDSRDLVSLESVGPDHSCTDSVSKWGHQHKMEALVLQIRPGPRSREQDQWWVLKPKTTYTLEQTSTCSRFCCSFTAEPEGVVDHGVSFFFTSRSHQYDNSHQVKYQHLCIKYDFWRSWNNPVKKTKVSKQDFLELFGAQSVLSSCDEHLQQFHLKRTKAGALQWTREDFGAEVPFKH